VAQFAPRPDPVNLANLVDDLGAQVAARYAEAEARMIERVARLAAAGIDATPDLNDRLRTLGDLRGEGARIAQQLADPAEVARIIGIAEAEGTQAALTQLGVGTQRLNASGLTGTSDRAVGALTLDLASGLDDMSVRITRWMPDAYQQVVSMTTPQVLAGVITVTQAQRMAASAFLARGITGFTDRAGRNWRIGTYAEMATRTSVHRAFTDANVFALQEQAGITLVQIVIGLDACSVCAAHAGRVWSTDGTPAGTYSRPNATTGVPTEITVAGTLDDARKSGWDHPNCRCTVVGYFPGLSTPTASAHDPQAEADRDRLRTLERRTRDLKRREAAAFDDVSKARLRKRIRNSQADIRQHVKVSGQVRKPYREQLGFSDGRAGGTPVPRPPTGGPRPPTPTPPTPTTPQPAITARAADVDAPPAWIREHRDATARIPADRNAIGRVNGQQLTPQQAQFNAGRPLYDERAAIQKQLDTIDNRLDYITEIEDWFRADPSRINATSWGDVQVFADGLGMRLGPNRFSSTFTSGGARAQYEKQRLGTLTDLSRAQARVTAHEARTFTSRLGGGTIDVDNLGQLGTATREALDATLDAGRVIDDEIARRLKLVQVQAIPSVDDLNAARIRMREADRLSSTFRNSTSELGLAAKQGAIDARQEVRRIVEARELGLAARAENSARITREVLGEVRDYGGGARSAYVTEKNRKAPAKLIDAMSGAHKNYPNAWNTYTAEQFPEVILKKVSRGYNKQGRTIALSESPRDGFRSVATHELGHSMERAVPGLSNLEWAFHYSRSDKVVDAATGSQRLAGRARIGGGMAKDEVHVPDAWANVYTGKTYTREALPIDDSWEVFTTGVESVFDGSPYFDRVGTADYAGGPDREFRRFILGVLSAL